jgi:hypothetical protein
MDIELPFGARLGVESVAKNAPVNAEQSDRELARIFLEMFDPIGDNTVSLMWVLVEAALVCN